MKILIITNSGFNKVIVTDILPRIGDSIDEFYSPYPKVVGVLLYPKEGTIKELSSDMPSDIDAIVTVD